MVLYEQLRGIFMLQIIIIWLLTIFASIGLNIVKDLVILKNIADAGYIIDSKKTNEFNDKVREINRFNSLNFMMYLGVNVMVTLMEMLRYTKYRDQLLMQLEMCDCLRKMPESLKKEYDENPSLLKAFKIVLKNASNDQILKIPAKDSEEVNEFRYQFDDTTNDIDILEVTGPAASLSYSEQRKMIIDAWKEIGRQVSYQYGSLENFGEALDDNRHIVLDDEPIKDIPSEKAIIKSIKLCQIDGDEIFFQLSLVDENGNNMGVFGSPYLTSNVDFRKEVYGILEAVEEMDLLKIGGNEEACIPIKFKCDRRDIVNEIHNDNNQTFHMNNLGEYVTEETKEDEREIFDGVINSIKSDSDTFMMNIRNPQFATSYVTSNIYYGFGYPFLSRTNNEELINKASKHYKEYIVNLLKFCGTDDLLRIGGEPTKYPETLIQRDELGNVIAIGSPNKDYHLRIVDDGYKMEKGKLVISKNKGKKLI